MTQRENWGFLPEKIHKMRYPSRSRSTASSSSFKASYKIILINPLVRILVPLMWSNWNWMNFNSRSFWAGKGFLKFSSSFENLKSSKSKIFRCGGWIMITQNLDQWSNINLKGKRHFVERRNAWKLTIRKIIKITKFIKMVYLGFYE